MEVNVRVTVDLGDKTMSLLGGFMAANDAVNNAANTAQKVLAKYADEPEAEQEKPTRTRRSRKTADEDERPKRSRKDAEQAADEPGTEVNEDAREDAEKPSNGVTHDDIRDLMAEVIEADENNRAKVLKQLNKIGAKSVGTIKDEDLAEFYEFLQALK